MQGLLVSILLENRKTIKLKTHHTNKNDDDDDSYTQFETTNQKELHID
jgi:hypothetical protein